MVNPEIKNLDARVSNIEKDIEEIKKGFVGKKVSEDSTLKQETIEVNKESIQEPIVKQSDSGIKPINVDDLIEAHFIGMKTMELNINEVSKLGMIDNAPVKSM